MSSFLNLDNTLYTYLFVLWQSVEQIGNRADRLNIETENLFLYSSTDVEVHDYVLFLASSFTIDFFHPCQPEFVV